jgi:23S rRNA pseudouridine2605 synthase
MDLVPAVGQRTRTGGPKRAGVARLGWERIYPVGRLDYASEGLLLLTNDGALANHLTRASSHVPKTYLVKVSGQPKEEDIHQLGRGIRIHGTPQVRGKPGRLRSKGQDVNRPGERTAPAQIRLMKEAENPWYEVTLIEGKNRQIRRMFEEIGHHVEKIKRVRYGPLTLDVEPGRFRELTLREVQSLRRSASEPEDQIFKSQKKQLSQVHRGRAGARQRRRASR